MRKINYYLSNFIIIICIASFISCNEDPADSSKEDDKVLWIKAEDIRGGTLSLEQGATFAIQLSLYPEEAIDKEEYTFQYKSSNDAVATVNETGIITALTVGQTTISIIPSHNEKLGFSFTLNVAAGAISVEDITLTDAVKDGITIESIGQTFDLSAHVTVTPEGATNKVVSYSTNKPEVAEVDEYGVITAISTGMATITVTSVENSLITKSVIVEVKDTPIKESVTLNKENWIVTESNEYLSLSGEETAEIVMNRVIDGAAETSIKFYKLGKGTRPADDPSNLYFVINRNNNCEYHSFKIIQPGGNGRANVTKVTIYGKNTIEEDWETIKENIPIPNSGTAGADSGEIDIKGDSPHTHQYIKVEITEWNTSNSTTTEMAEFDLIGYED